MQNNENSEWMRARLAAIESAVRCAITEEGTTREQDELLFETGFIHELRTITSCGTSITLVRVDGRVEGRMDPYAWLTHYRDNPIVGVGSIGLVRVEPPSDEDMVDHYLREELGSNALQFLPVWGKEAVRKAFLERFTVPGVNDGVHIGELPSSPVIDDEPAEIAVARMLEE